jgi:DNA repair protein RAD5
VISANANGDVSWSRLRQAVNHPLLVMSKASSGGDEGKDDMISGQAGDSDDIKQLITDFTNGRDAGEALPDEDKEDSQPAASSQTLQTLEGGETRLCLFCHEEVEAEVILPCFHTG